MALSKTKKLEYAAIMLMNRVIKIDIYGVRLFGIQFTPKATADALKVDGQFSSNQQEHFNIKLWFRSVYVFMPRIA